jgi:hypothetical protein
MSNFMKIPLVGPKLFHADVQIWQADSRFPQFYSFHDITYKNLDQIIFHHYHELQSKYIIILHTF